jgi:hypothetical protein
MSWERVAAQREGRRDWAGRLKAGTGPTQESPFQIFLNFGFGRTLENCTARFYGIWTQGFSLKSFKFSRDFRKMKYGLP